MISPEDFKKYTNLILVVPEMVQALEMCECFLSDQEELGLDVPELKIVRNALAKAGVRIEEDD